MNESTMLNGLAAFEALYFVKGKKLMKDILNHRDGEFGVPGYATIVVADGIFGKGTSIEKFVEVLMRLNVFAEELSEAI